MQRTRNVAWIAAILVASLAHGDGREEKAQVPPTRSASADSNRQQVSPPIQALAKYECGGCYVDFINEKSAVPVRICGAVPTSNASQKKLDLQADDTGKPEADMRLKAEPQMLAPSDAGWDLKGGWVIALCEKCIESHCLYPWCHHPEPHPGPGPGPRPPRGPGPRLKSDPGSRPLLPGLIKVGPNATLILFEESHQQGDHHAFVGPKEFTLESSCPKEVKSIQLMCKEGSGKEGTQH